MGTLLAAVALTGGGCSSTINEHGKVVQALMPLLATGNDRLCIDSVTRGHPLAIFRTMMAAPAAARRPLAWHLPTSLRPPQPLSQRQIFDEIFATDHVLIAPPMAQGARLSALVQSQLNAAARSTLISGDIEQTVVDRPSATSAVEPRWWALNRIWPQCPVIYTVSNPVIGGRTAFVSVTSGHWGTTYALHRDAAAWTPIAQWTNWLY